MLQRSQTNCRRGTRIRSEVEGEKLLLMTQSISTATTAKQLEILRAPAEIRYAGELELLAAKDTHQRPPGWKLSPQAVRTFVLGSQSGGSQGPKSKGIDLQAVFGKKSSS